MCWPDNCRTRERWLRNRTAVLETSQPVLIDSCPTGTSSRTGCRGKIIGPGGTRGWPVSIFMVPISATAGTSGLDAISRRRISTLNWCRTPVSTAIPFCIRRIPLPGSARSPPRNRTPKAFGTSTHVLPLLRQPEIPHRDRCGTGTQCQSHEWAILNHTMYEFDRPNLVRIPNEYHDGAIGQRTGFEAIYHEVAIG